MSAERDRPSDWQSRFVAAIPGAVALFDCELRYRAASAGWSDAFGLSRASLSGHRHDELCWAGRQGLFEVQRRALAGEPVGDYQILEDDPARRAAAILSADTHRDPDGAIAGVIVTLRPAPSPGEMSAGSPLPDPLTGVADRRGLARCLREVLGASEPAGRNAVVIAIGIGGLRHINTLYGGTIGDEVLRITAERLVSGTRSSRREGETWRSEDADMVGRIGADEFAVICGSQPSTPAAAEAVASRLLRLVESPIAVGGQSLRLDANAGLVRTLPSHGHADEVLRDLDLALQQAKALGPGKAIAWQQAMTSAATRRYSLAAQLRQASDNGEFALHYQPVLHLGDHRMVGAEALLRWNHPSEGLIASSAFIPILEETGLIAEVGNWAIREAVRQVQSWHMLYGRHIVEWVSVNLSARQFDDPARLLATLRAIDAGGFSLHRLKLEITETALMRDKASTGAVLAELRSLGLRVAIDDFGTGNSSLNSLRRNPVDTIKIDGEFIAQVGTADGEKLLQALLQVAQLYGAAIVAEGIETAAQHDFLRDRGCQFGQGYFFAEPMDGALLGAYALTHAVDNGRDRARGRLAG